MEAATSFETLRIAY